MMRSVVFSFAVMVALVLPAFVLAQQEQQGNQQEQFDEKKAVAKAIDFNSTEIKLAEVAKEKASNPEVKTLATKIHESHNKCREKMMACAKELNIAVATGTDRQIQEEVDRLENLAGGRAFDQAYLQGVVNRHQKALQFIEDMNKNAQNQQVRTEAQNGRRELEQHLRTAQQLLERLQKERDQ